MHTTFPPLLMAALPASPAAAPIPSPRTGAGAAPPPPRHPRRLGRALRGFGAPRRPLGRAALWLAFIFGDY